MQRLRQLLKTSVSSILILNDETCDYSFIIQRAKFHSSKVKKWTLLPNYVGCHFSVQLAAVSCETHESAKWNIIFTATPKQWLQPCWKKHSYILTFITTVQGRTVDQRFEQWIKGSSTKESSSEKGSWKGSSRKNKLNYEFFSCRRILGIYGQ